MGEEKQAEHAGPNGVIKVGRGRSSGTKDEVVEWDCEEAKLHMIKHKMGVRWNDLYQVVKQEVETAMAAEKTGFRMIA